MSKKILYRNFLDVFDIYKFTRENNENERVAAMVNYYFVDEWRKGKDREKNSHRNGQ